MLLKAEKKKAKKNMDDSQDGGSSDCSDKTTEDELTDTLGIDDELQTEVEDGDYN